MYNKERIYMFGAKGCKFCKIQKNYLDVTFGNNNWTYIDIKEDKKALEVADEIGLENIPSIVLFNSKFQEIHRKDGTMPPDQIFNTLHGNKKTIPVANNIIIQIKNKKRNYIILSYPPSFQEGEEVLLSSYNDEKIGYAKIDSIIKVATDYLDKKYGNKIKSEYLNQGGKKDWSWVINFCCFKEDE